MIDTLFRQVAADRSWNGETQIEILLRYLLRAAGQERHVSPSELTRYLGVSTASTTAIIDRLERSGHVTRVPHPTDRRSVRIVATVASDEEVRKTLGAMHGRMMAAVVDMSPEECAVVIDCLGRLQDALDQVEPHDPPHGDDAALPT